MWGFRNIKLDNFFFTLNEGNNMVILLVYMDDILITGNDKNLVDEIIMKMNENFSLKVLGKLSYFLGIEAKRDKHGLHLSQKKYIHDLLFRTKIQEYKSSPTPISISEKFRKKEKKISVTKHYT